MKTQKQQVNVMVSNIQNLLWEYPDPHQQELILECLYRMVHEPEIWDSRNIVEVYQRIKNANGIGQDWIDTIKVTEGW